MRRKLGIVAVCMAVSLTLAGCSASSVEKNVTDAANEINDQVSDVTDRQDEHVLFVKNGHPVSYPKVPYGKALDEFFEDAKWKYFKAESGEDVVEFTGYCLYQDTKVKARLQFILDMDEGTFTQGALSFNDVPQNNLITGTMLVKAFDQYAEKHNIIDEGDVDESAFEAGTVAQTDSTQTGSTQEETEQTPVITEEPTPEPEENTDYAYEEDDTDDEDDSEYILPYSDTESVTKADLEYLTKEQCRIARNEIYARHGRRFNDKKLQAYFDKQSWYFGSVEADEFDESVLNSVEKANAKFILKYENKLK